MALKKTTPAADSKPAAAAFEGMEESNVEVLDKPVAAETVVATQPATATVTDTAATPAPADKPAATEVAVKGSSAVSTVVPKKKFQAAFEDLRNVFDPAVMDFNTFVRVVVGLDGFSDDADKDLGKELKLEMLSFNNRFVASPGVDNDEAKAAVRYSIDGKTIEGTEDSIHEYVKQLKEVDGYDEASLKEYLTIYGFLVAADGKEIPVEDRIIIALQVPPQSRAHFTRYQIETGIKVGMGVLQESPILFCRQQKAVNGTKKYALINFGAK